MAKVFRSYCPCKRLNDAFRNWCTVCGKLIDVNNQFSGGEGSFCKCSQPIIKEVTDDCAICGKSLRFYATPKMDFTPTTFCNCVALTRTVQGNLCEVCDKPKILDKKKLFCYCYRLTSLTKTGECLDCGKPKFCRLENNNDRCFCAQKTKTDQQEACLNCGKRKIADGVTKYCYMKNNINGCPFSEKKVLFSAPLVNNAVCCPLEDINLCPWIGDIKDMAQHCQRNHPQNFFHREATVLCAAHLKEYTEFEYYSTEFLIHTYDKLFKCSFEVNWKKMMKWSISFLNGPDADENQDPNQTYRFYVEFLNHNREHMSLDAYCTKQTAPSIFAEFVTTAQIQKDHLRPFYDKAGHILYRIFIVEIPQAPLVMMANYYEKCRGYFMLDWSQCKLPEPTVYDDNCRCVKICRENLS